MNIANKLALALCLIGGINWGLMGLFKFDLLGWIFGCTFSMISRIIFVLVAIAAVWCINLLFRDLYDRMMEHHE